MRVKKCTGLIGEQTHTSMRGAAATATPAASAKHPMIVADVLPTGQASAVTSQALCDLLGFESPRELQKEIARERAAGAVILSSCRDGGGYFLPETNQEVKAFIKTLENRGKNTFMALKSARNYLKKQEGSKEHDDITGTGSTL